MKVSKRSLVVVAVVAALVAVLALLSGASAQGPVTDKSTSGAAHWSALDKVERLEKTLQGAGFSLTPGQFTYWDMVQANA